MRMKATQPQGIIVSDPRARRPRAHHPEDFGRGPWWRLAELFFLGYTFPSPRPVARLWPEDDDAPESQPGA